MANVLNIKRFVIGVSETFYVISLECYMEQAKPCKAPEDEYNLLHITPSCKKALNDWKQAIFSHSLLIDDATPNSVWHWVLIRLVRAIMVMFRL